MHVIQQGARIPMGEVFEELGLLGSVHGDQDWIKLGFKFGWNDEIRILSTKYGDTGFFKKNSHQSTKKFQHAPEAPGSPVSMLLTIASKWTEQEWLFLSKAPPAFTLKLGDQGWLTVLARIQVGWLFFGRTRYQEQNGDINHQKWL